MISLLKKINVFWLIILCLFSYAAAQQLDYYISPAREARKAMSKFYIGRFSITIPKLLELKNRFSKIRYVEIDESIWPAEANGERAQAEWENFLAGVKEQKPPEGKSCVVIREHDFSSAGRWSKGIFYYDDFLDSVGGKWSVFMDAGPMGVWFTGEESVVDKEMASPRMLPNLQNIIKSYQLPGLDNQPQKQSNKFYLKHGVINLPYDEEEESVARFEGHPLDLTLLIEMVMDVGHSVETISLIDGTRAMLAAALLIPGGGMSKIRLRKREVAGMSGEESVLRVREGKRKDLVFTWQFNGRDDSGEYPTTRIEMESPDGHLSEKLEIWDAILDSMKPMFVRKKP